MTETSGSTYANTGGIMQGSNMVLQLRQISNTIRDGLTAMAEIGDFAGQDSTGQTFHEVVDPAVLSLGETGQQVDGGFSGIAALTADTSGAYAAANAAAEDMVHRG